MSAGAPRTSYKVINEYANSMFRYEHLHEQWLDSCTAYLHSLFGDSLRGKTVIDYAFGRGNWSVAFARIGAAKVIAIDASVDNVGRFSSYCHKNRIANIDVLHGNILEQNMNFKADFFWIYGILNNIQDSSLFLNKLVDMISDENARFFVYHYDARSLRQFVVESCRKIIIYSNEDSFIKDSYLFVPAARMRARDDLTAPYITFADAQELYTLLKSCGISVLRSCSSFQEFQTGKASPEFLPYHFLCDFISNKRDTIRNEPRAFLRDISVLKELTNCLWALNIAPSIRKKLAIGLYNTHFASLFDPHDVTLVIRNDFLFLFYALVKNKVDFDSFTPLTRRCLKAAVKSLEGKHSNLKPPESKTYFNDSYILDFLNCNNVRI
jgi:hypothetical protein